MAERVFTEQGSGRSWAHPSTHKRRWLSICSGASQEFWVLAVMYGDGSQRACQGVWILVTSTEMDILVGRHRKLAVKLSMILSSALIVSRLKNLFIFSLA